MKGTHQLLVYANDINLLGENNTINKITEAHQMLVKEDGLEASTEKTKYTFSSCHQNAGHNHNLTTLKQVLQK
jgi:hypothetical protein